MDKTQDPFKVWSDKWGVKDPDNMTLDEKLEAIKDWTRIVSSLKKRRTPFMDT